MHSLLVKAVRRINFLTKNFYYFVLYICIYKLAKRGRVFLLFSERLNSFPLSQARISILSCKLDYAPVYFDADANRPEYISDITASNFKQLEYKGLNLLNLSLYSICCELNVYKDELRFDAAVHRKVIIKWYSKCRAAIDSVEILLKKVRPSVVLTQRGNYYNHMIIRLLSTRHNPAVYNIESTSNTDKLRIDRFLPDTDDSQLVWESFTRFTDIPEKEFLESYIRRLKSVLKKNKRPQHSSPEQAPKLNINKKKILFLGQVYTDGSLLNGLSPAFKNPVKVIECLMDFCSDNQHLLMIKLHPKEYLGDNPVTSEPYRSLTWKKILNSDVYRKHRHNSENLIIDHSNEWNTYSLIHQSDLVVTVNSQSGLEALVLGKPVILCGSAFYRNLKSTYLADSESKLIEKLDTLLSNNEIQVDQEEIYRFVYFYFEKYCVPCNEKSVTEKVLSAF